MTDTLTAQTVELLQAMIQNQCVNDGTTESGHEVRNADTLTGFLGETGLDIERFEPAPGRVSLVTRIEGSDPNAPKLCLMGHTDVVPVNMEGWKHDPFGGELIDGEVWGRGALDMLNITASMAVAFKHLAKSKFRPAGDLIYFAVADEESGSAHGAQWMADNHKDRIFAEYVLTESGGLHSGGDSHPKIGINVAEKGVAWRRLTLRGTPGHGSMPFRGDNALVKAAGVIQRLADYRPAPRFNDFWTQQVKGLNIDDDVRRALLDPNEVDNVLTSMPNKGSAAYLHACIHTTFSPNLVVGEDMKANVIPDTVEVQVDIRTLPGETEAEVEFHLKQALGPLADEVEIHPIMNDEASTSRTDNPLWDALGQAASAAFPRATLSPAMTVGFTDARIYRQMGSVAYGAGLFSPHLDPGEFASRFHGHNERIDLESLGLTTQLWLDTVRCMNS